MKNKKTRMKTRMLCTFMLLILTSTTFQAPASVAAAFSFDGEWVNVNNQTHGVTRLVINEEVASSKIEAWGRCHPNDCYWGKVDLKLVGRSVTDHLFEYALAVWEHSHATQYMLLTRKEQTMTVETITIFKDGSSRSNYRIREEMRRASEVISGDNTKAVAPIQISPADGSVFDHYPRKTKLIWAEVANARSYAVEIDFIHPLQGGEPDYIRTLHGWRPISPQPVIHLTLSARSQDAGECGQLMLMARKDLRVTGGLSGTHDNSRISVPSVRQHIRVPPFI